MFLPILCWSKCWLSVTAPLIKSCLIKDNVEVPMDTRAPKVIGMGPKTATDDMLIAYFVHRETDDPCGTRWSGSHHEAVWSRGQVMATIDLPFTSIYWYSQPKKEAKAIEWCICANHIYLYGMVDNDQKLLVLLLSAHRRTAPLFIKQMVHLQGFNYCLTMYLERRRDQRTMKQITTHIILSH